MQQHNSLIVHRKRRWQRHTGDYACTRIHEKTDTFIHFPHAVQTFGCVLNFFKIRQNVKNWFEIKSELQYIFIFHVTCIFCKIDECQYFVCSAEICWFLFTLFIFVHPASQCARNRNQNVLRMMKCEPDQRLLFHFFEFNLTQSIRRKEIHPMAIIADCHRTAVRFIIEYFCFAIVNTSSLCWSCCLRNALYDRSDRCYKAQKWTRMIVAGLLGKQNEQIDTVQQHTAVYCFPRCECE